MKIISFGLWGNKPKYCQGAIENARLQPKIYDGWKCRFYVDETVPRDVINTLEENSEVVEMPRSDGNYGLFWRFEPLKDDSIERFIVRDTDSRLNVREADAVKEWENSDLNFHIMRDHVQHKVLICGGMWGATIDFIDKIKFDYDELLFNYLKGLSFQELYKQRGKYFNTDQPFLWKHIWPRVLNSHMAHIRRDCNLEITRGERYFKVELPNGQFVGQDINV